MIMPFSKDTDYIPDDKTWMINFRVSDLDGLVAELRKTGMDVHTDPAWDTPETGRFARIHDPEGNRIELWEPPQE
jgi:predicted enzyme related to lactoylglutathione lyase